MFEVSEPYEPRPVEFLRVHEHGGWRSKAYSIVYGSRPFDAVAHDEGLQRGIEVLPQPAVDEHRTGVALRDPSFEPTAPAAAASMR